MRVAKLSSSGTVETVFVLTAGNKQLTELNGSGGWNHTNIYAPGGRLLATYDASGQPSPGYHYNLTDWLGTKRMQTTSGRQFAGDLHQQSVRRRAQLHGRGRRHGAALHGQGSRHGVES